MAQPVLKAVILNKYRSESIRSTGRISFGFYILAIFLSRIFMYFVYLIKSINYPEQKYVGYTTNLKSRLETHNSGGSPHTAKYRPWKLYSFVAFGDKYRALEFERYLKSHAGKAFSNKRLW